jgi:hypothetical protein
LYDKEVQFYIFHAGSAPSNGSTIFEFLGRQRDDRPEIQERKWTANRCREFAANETPVVLGYEKQPPE